LIAIFVVLAYIMTLSRRLLFLPGLMFLLMVVYPLSGRAKSDQGKKITGQQSSSDSLEVSAICEDAKECLEVRANPAGADSLSESALQIVMGTYDNKLILESLNNFFETTDPTYNYKKTIGYARKAEELSREIKDDCLQWRTLYNIANIYCAGYEYDKAVTASYKSFETAIFIKNANFKCKSYLSIGQSLEGKNQKIEAFRNYLNALSLAEGLKDIDLISDCLGKLSQFYSNNKVYDKAIDYRLRQIAKEREKEEIDSTALMWGQYELEVISYLSDKERVNDRNIQRILQYANRHGNIKLKNYTIALYRTHLIEARKFGLLRALYVDQFPDELEYLKEKDLSMYLRLYAFFSEDKMDLDSARIYFRQAESIISLNPNKILQSNFNIRYGQFLFRINDITEAIDKFKKAYDLSTASSYFEYMLESSKNLEKLYARTNDFKNAYLFASINHELSDSLLRLTKKDELLKLEIETEEKLTQMALEQAIRTTRQRHNLQYTVIIILIASTFIFLAMLGSFTVPEWYIRVFGFFAFIFLFEFIILLIDQKVHHITHGEPWLILLIKIGVIAFMLPLHHWMEHKATMYLTRHKLINFSSFSARKYLDRFTRKFYR